MLEKPTATMNWATNIIYNVRCHDGLSPLRILGKPSLILIDIFLLTRGLPDVYLSE